VPLLQRRSASVVAARIGEATVAGFLDPCGCGASARICLAQEYRHTAIPQSKRKWIRWGS